MGSFTRGRLATTVTREKAWAELAKVEPRPDVALLQEATMPPEPLALEPGVAEGSGARISSRIWAPGYELIEPTTLEDIGEHGYVMTARIEPAAKEVSLISLHARTQGEGAVAHIQALFKRLDGVFKRGPFILAGDFNSCRRAHVLWPAYRHVEFFERVEADYGMFDCFWRTHGYEERTYWKNCADEGEPFQDDHIFVSQDLAEAVSACKVMDYEPFRGLSDHAPIYADLDLR